MSFEKHPVNLLNIAGAPDFVTFDAQQLLDAAIAHFEAETGRTLSPSQVEMYLLETIAYMLTIRGGEEQLAFENCFVAYANNAFLDRHGAGYNTPRLQASPATTTLRFICATPAAARIQIPLGTRVGDVPGQVQFATTKVSYIEVGQTAVDVLARASEVGIVANNFPVGVLTSLIDPLPGIGSVSNLTATGGGADIESDDRYRVRIALAFERLGEGLAKERYLTDVLAWNARCIDVAISRPQPGYVNLYPLMDTGEPNAEELASLLKVFDESNIHQGDFIQVFAPTAVEFDVELELDLSNPDADVEAIAAVQSVLDQWSSTLGGYIAPSELIRVAKAVVGVVEADIPELTLVSVAQNAWRKGAISSVTVRTVNGA
tara:strand:- start:1932 stop:3056 length:1125 start_codon:yes stop_codon:yes gene_type:complete